MFVGHSRGERAPGRFNCTYLVIKIVHTKNYYVSDSNAKKYWLMNFVHWNPEDISGKTYVF